MEAPTFDYIIIGSGFGGSVSAMRLSEKGYSVAVLEKGKRFTDEDFPKTNRETKKYLWLPALRFYGPQLMKFFRKSFVLGGIGVGGGSLVYANTHMVPSDFFFKNPVWAKYRDWRKTLMPFYDEAKFMLGTVHINNFNREDEALKAVAQDMGRGDTFDGVNAGVYFGDTKNPVDPYFQGLGPLRHGCRECAGCMVGCRYNAKNTLDKNYLWFAEKNGAIVFPETQAVRIEFKDGCYHVHTRKGTAFFARDKKVFTARGIIFSGGVLGTLDLLLQQKHRFKTLPKLSDKLGKNIRTNSKSICGVTASKEKLNNSISITSVFEPDEHTHIEIVKYSDSADAMKWFSVPLTGKGPFRGLKMFWNIATQPLAYLKILANKKWSEGSILILFMQTVDSAMEMQYRTFPWSRITLRNKGKQKVPVFNETAQEVTRRYAEKVGGIPGNSFSEALFNMATGDHIMGGCPMGETADEGVVNERFEVHGYSNMYILDGTIIPCNPGVNPSLTITALSEYAMSLIPEKAGNTRKSLKQQLAEIESLG